MVGFATKGRTRRLTLSLSGLRLKVTSGIVVTGGALMASIDDELTQIERDIRTLKIEYEQYFGGGRKRPPNDTQWRLDSMLRRCAERAGELNYGQRFRYNNLTQTYAKYQDMWRKKLIQKETGAQQHHFGAAAKAIEAERARRAATQGGAAGLASAADERKRKGGDAASFALTFADPTREQEKIEELYRGLIEARRATGEQAGAPSLKDFERFVQQKTQELRKKGAHRVEYAVTIEGGRVRLKAKVSN
jgi:hypothetical protein